jgi:hypothetical protein
METASGVFWLFAWPVLMALAAVGALLLIKITRRRQGTVHPEMTASVPVRPLAAADARRMLRRYAWSVGAVLAILLVLAAIYGGATW